MSHTEKIIVRDSHGTTIIIDGKPYKQIAIVLSSNPGIKPDEATGHNRRLVACWKDHDGLVHDNSRLYQSLQGEMQSRIKAEQERDEALEVLRMVSADFKSTLSEDMEMEVFNFLAKHKVTG